MKVYLIRNKDTKKIVDPKSHKKAKFRVYSRLNFARSSLKQSYLGKEEIKDLEIVEYELKETKIIEV